jgi:hypothetical protein
MSISLGTVSKMTKGWPSGSPNFDSVEKVETLGAFAMYSAGGNF